MSEDDGLKAMGQVIQIDEARIRDHLGEMVRGTVEEKPVIFSRRSAAGSPKAFDTLDLKEAKVLLDELHA
jgi:hypothetical protein